MKCKRGLFIAIIGMLCCFFMFPYAAIADEELTYDLDEKKDMHQFIIEGENNDFDVDMVLPDGTTIDFEEFDEEKFMYFSLENKRIWAVSSASKGTYTFKVSGDDDFSVSTKDSVERPEMKWKKPKDETIKVKGDEEIPLTWSVSGEFSSSYGNLDLNLKQKDGWHTFHVGNTSAESESYDLEIPSSIPSGEYGLKVQFDDTNIKENDFDPGVIIDYTNPDFDMEKVELVEQKVENGALYAILEIPDYSHFSEVEAEIVKSDEDSGSIHNSSVDDLTLIKELDESKQYLWPVTEIEEDGKYEGAMIVLKGDKEFSEVIPFDPFDVTLNSFDDDQIEWSIEEGLTNASAVKVTVNAPEGTYITIEDDGNTLLDEKVKEEGDIFTAALEEGFRVIEVILSDEHNNNQTYSRHFQVDHTPPLLEMIQPLASHTQLEQSYASGYVDTDSELKVNGNDVTYDETGYFKVENFGNKLNINVTDESGNKTQYQWAPTDEEQKNNWLTFTFIGIGLLLAAIAFIYYLRKTRTT